MRKIILLLCLCLMLAGVMLLSLVGCDSEPVSLADSSADVPTKNNSTTFSSQATASDLNAYLETSSEQSVAYNKAIAAYNMFLNRQITAKSNDGTHCDVLQYGVTGNGIFSFALGDVNNDDVPELFIHSDHYAIISFDGKDLVEWYVSMSWQRISLLENGAVLDMHSSIGVVYNYITFDADGIEKSVNFGKSAEGEPIQTFYFGENGSSKNVSKEEWEERTRPYFEQAKKTVELNWIEWK